MKETTIVPYKDFFQDIVNQIGDKEEESNQDPIFLSELAVFAMKILAYCASQAPSKEWENDFIDKVTSFIKIESNLNNTEE